MYPALQPYPCSLAANAGQHDAMFALGFLYEGYFDGVPHDSELAQYWYGLAERKRGPSTIQKEEKSE